MLLRVGLFCIGRLIVSSIKRSIRHKFLRVNYNGKSVDYLSGSDVIVNLLLVEFCIKRKHNNDYLFSCLLIYFVGLLDDIYHNSQYRGLRGHINALLKDKHITTGLLKMLFIPIAGYIYNGNRNPYIQSIMHASFANLLNLLDTRPKRVINIYILMSLISKKSYSDLLLSILYILFIIHPDFNEYSMLGDSGSNLLGFIIAGSFLDKYYNNKLLVSLSLLFAISSIIISEKYSFNKILALLK